MHNRCTCDLCKIHNDFVDTQARINALAARTSTLTQTPDPIDAYCASPDHT